MLDVHPDYEFCKELGCTEVSLGIQEMPKNYTLFLNADQSHYFWFNKVTGVESDIHWSKWAVYRGAKRHAFKEGHLPYWTQSFRTMTLGIACVALFTNFVPTLRHTGARN